MDPFADERPIDILLVEDHPGDVRLTKEAFRDRRITNDLHVVNRGSEALDYLHQRGEYDSSPRPDIVLLDLNLPDVDGQEVLEEVKDEAPPEVERIPVIVLTGSEAQEDVIRSYEQHANAYLTKPVDPDEFVDLARSITDFWIQMVELPGKQG